MAITPFVGGGHKCGNQWGPQLRGIEQRWSAIQEQSEFGQEYADYLRLLISFIETGIHSQHP